MFWSESVQILYARAGQHENTQAQELYIGVDPRRHKHIISCIHTFPNDTNIQTPKRQLSWSRNFQSYRARRLRDAFETMGSISELFPCACSINRAVTSQSSCTAMTSTPRYDVELHWCEVDLTESYHATYRLWPHLQS